uniref:Uncharacterized protein n=1 Tax=Amphora coffeiformis TaxID=265554 RepID=A0A7S3P9U8_9STRA|mmetsp:Transcript_14751/g.28037  ORF Transcript_14751/g.28037 Transcript_14751/m.28037 type:complete len:125 (+) Transcript_14751:100-474(+)|eukprot:scaffold6749_cov162-Amphora_coffeaeformis.AAC.3
MHLFTLLGPRFCRQGLSSVRKTGISELLVAQHATGRYNIRLFSLPASENRAAETSTNKSRDDDDDEWTCLPSKPPGLSTASPPNEPSQQPQQEDNRVELHDNEEDEWTCLPSKPPTSSKAKAST